MAIGYNEAQSKQKAIAYLQDLIKRKEAEIKRYTQDTPKPRQATNLFTGKTYTSGRDYSGVVQTLQREVKELKNEIKQLERL